MAATWQRVKSHAGARLREIDLSENVCKTSVRIYMHLLQAEGRNLCETVCMGRELSSE